MKAIELLVKCIDPHEQTLISAQLEELLDQKDHPYHDIALECYSLLIDTEEIDDKCPVCKGWKNRWVKLCPNLQEKYIECDACKGSGKIFRD